MFGAIVGDVIGSVYEFNNVRTVDFPLFTRYSDFTDDSVMTVAIADAILNRSNGSGATRTTKALYAHKLKEYGRRFPHRGYGGMFQQWLENESMGPYHSFGNGSAMRVSPIGFAYSSLKEVLTEAKLSALVTHNHPEGVKGAQATASAIFLARQGVSKDEIKEYIKEQFYYNLGLNIDELRIHYQFNETCQGTVPQAIAVFLQSLDFEDAVRKAVSIGGDSDTIACITGGIAQAFYGKIPQAISSKVNLILDSGIKAVISRFNEKYGILL